MSGIFKGAFEPNIIAFLCNWCSYVGADLAGISRIRYPANVKVVRVMCSGRVNPLFVIYALRHGLDGILIAGCHPGDCHYLQGNYIARRRLVLMRRLIEYVGIDPRRLRVSWVSASEGAKFADLVKEMVDEIKKLGPIEQFHENI